MRQNKSKLYSMLAVLIVVLTGYLVGNEVTFFLILLITITMWPVILPIMFIIILTILAIFFLVPRFRRSLAKVLFLLVLFVVVLLLSSARISIKKHAKRDMELDGVIRAIQEYKSKENKVPSEIQDLIPEYLDENIVDNLVSEYNISYDAYPETGEFKLCYTAISSTCYRSELGNWKTFPN